jgi:predicted glycogen debranching enzyme
MTQRASRERTPPASPPDRGEVLASDDTQVHLELEWLETDGHGGYASSTTSLCPTRRQHGWLVGPWGPGRERYVFLARIDEEVRGDGWVARISTARYDGALLDDGVRCLASVELAPFPRFRHALPDGGMLTRELQLLPGRRAVLVRYANEGGAPVALRLRPLLAYRAADALTFENLALDPRVERRGPGGVRLRPYAALPPLSLGTGGSPAEFEVDPVWYRRHEYAEDLRRGYDGHEDAFAPGWIAAELAPGADLIVLATVQDPAPDELDLRVEWEDATERRRVRVGAAPPPRDALETLAARLDAAAERFLYRAPSGRIGVIAGFPWFLEWGRDTFIALPGLTAARGRVEELGLALEGACPFLRDGLLPNVFGPTPAESDYGSGDAALWFARAVREYELAGGSAERVANVLQPALNEIAERYLQGTHLGIREDEEGLLRVGCADTNATWMDARVDGRPVTPRDGAPVETSALWYLLLAMLERWSKPRSRERAIWRGRRERTGEAFLRRFWMPATGALRDVWNPDRPDAGGDAVRPNMVLAAALEHSPLERRQRASIVRIAREKLLTPRGLRTLAPDDPGYRPVYAGGPAERDGAYHQGTVWPWLLGSYVEAALRAFGRRTREPVVRELPALLEGFLPHLDEAGWNQVSEVFDAEPPHRPGGTPAQAWSVAELLRALHLWLR